MQPRGKAYDCTVVWSPQKELKQVALLITAELFLRFLSNPRSASLLIFHHKEPDEVDFSKVC